MRRKFAVLFLVLAMITSMVGFGPAAIAEPAERNWKEFEGTTITIAYPLNSSDESESQNDKEAIKQACEATGINVEWVMVEEAGKAETLNIMLASADQRPDVFLNMCSESVIASEFDAFYDLSEEGLLETYAPNVVAAVESHMGWGPLTWPDGSIRTLACGEESNFTDTAGSCHFINIAWLEKLGLEMPTTADEYYEVLKAFKTQDPNGNGEADEIAITFCDNNWAGHFSEFLNAFGMAGGRAAGKKNNFYEVENGVVQPTIGQDNFRKAIEFFHKLAEEGILDIEGFTQTSEQYKAKIQSGNVGVFLAYEQLSHLNNEMKYDYSAFVPVQGIEGVEVEKQGEQGKIAANRTGFAVAADTENIGAVLTWWDYLHSSTDLKYTAIFGPKGMTWNIDENGNYFVYDNNDAEKSIPDGMTATTAQYTFGVRQGAPFIAYDELWETKGKDDYTSRAGSCELYWDYLQDEHMPVRFADPDTVAERTFIETDLFPYIINFTATAVVEGIDDAGWEAHLDNLEAYGYYEWIDWYQQFYDGKI